MKTKNWLGCLSSTATTRLNPPQPNPSNPPTLTRLSTHTRAASKVKTNLGKDIPVRQVQASLQVIDEFYPLFFFAEIEMKYCRL